MKYKDKLSGKEFTFTPKPDQIMVKFSPEVDMAAATRALEDDQVMTPLYESTLSRGYGVFQITTDLGSVADLAESSEIESVFPVVIDNEGNERFFIPGEITVQFEQDVSEEDQEKIIADQNCTIIRKQFTPGYYTVGLTSDKDIFDAVEDFNALDEVLFAEPSNAGYYDAAYIPSNSEFHQQWYLHNTGQTGGSPDCDVDAPEAWNIERGESDIVIAILDTGVDLDHPDLQAGLVPQPAGEDWDFADPDLLPEPGPEWWEDHGTHCAGIAAAVESATGVIGLAPGCSILPIRIDLHGGAYANRADAINFVTSISHRFKQVVMSCSWVTSGSVAAIANAIINANSSNVLVCFAAGNDDRDTDISPRYPGVMLEVLSVAATDHNDVRASFSNYGSTVDVSAPGKSIFSTIPNDTHGSKSGTSMSCPLTAGLAGLIWSKNPTLTNQEVRSLIEGSSDNIDGANPAFVGKLGSGRINAFKALQATPNLCGFEVLGRFKFPQLNAGSSSALTFYYQSLPWYPYPYRLKRYLLFLTQQAGSERIYFLNPTTGAVVRSIDPPRNETIGSMTWDMNVIRVANVTTGSGFINSLNPATGAQVASIPAPPGRGEGMTFDGRDIFYSTINMIHRIDPATGVVADTFPVPGGGRCRALASDGRNLLFAGDPFNNEIIVFEKNSLRVVCRFDAPGKGNYRVDGLAYDRLKKILYIANQSDNMIYFGRLQ